MEKRKFFIRIYTPGDPFHKRASFWEKRSSGDEYLQFALGNWAIMGGWVLPIGLEDMPFFMWVNHE